MTILDEILEWNQDVDFIKIDGMDKAVIGIEIKTERLVYSESKIIEELMNQQEMEYAEAYHWYSYNILDAYVDDNQPIIIKDYS
jgi:hypothetical protein